MSKEYFMDGLCIGLIIGLTLSLVVYLVTTWNTVYLSQETVDDICINLANNSAATGSRGINSELVCTIPNYDSTNNIIIKDSAGEIIR